MTAKRYVLGIDGGGTKTSAWVAEMPAGEWPAAVEAAVAGRGSAGAANPQTVGWDAATANLDRAVDAAVADSAIGAERLAAIVLGLAGSDRPAARERLSAWASARGWSGRFRAVHDALPVLSAGSPAGWGVAVIAGTGSLAFGRSTAGAECRAGGWGWLFGDEGSGYAVALAGLRAAAKAADGRGPSTAILPALLDRLDITRPEELVPAVYAMAADRAALAALAATVTMAAEAGDTTARRIVDQAAEDLAEAAAVAARLAPRGEPIPLALAGGLLLGCRSLRAAVVEGLRDRGCCPEPVALVAEPVAGAVRLAWEAAAGGGRRTWS